MTGKLAIAQVCLLQLKVKKLLVLGIWTDRIQNNFLKNFQKKCELVNLRAPHRIAKVQRHIGYCQAESRFLLSLRPF